MRNDEERGASATRDDDYQPEASTETKLDQLYALIDGIEVAMMTTRTADGALVSRPMQVQGRDPGTDLWFMTVADSGKVAEINAEPNVNLGFYKDGSREWVSIHGRARVTQDPDKIRRLYKPDWKMWLPDEGGDRNGGPEDPRIALIEVDAMSATYLKMDQPRPLQWLSFARAMVSGTTPKIGVMGELDASQLARGAGRKS